jgi:hypothetical protein
MQAKDKNEWKNTSVDDKKIPKTGRILPKMPPVKKMEKMQ